MERYEKMAGWKEVNAYENTDDGNIGLMSINNDEI